MPMTFSIFTGNKGPQLEHKLWDHQQFVRVEPARFQRQGACYMCVVVPVVPFNSELIQR